MVRPNHEIEHHHHHPLMNASRARWPRPSTKGATSIISTTMALLMFFFFLMAGVLYSGPNHASSLLSGISSEIRSLNPITTQMETPKYPLQCTKLPNETQTCPINNYPTTHNPTNPDRPSKCPSYFRWIHEDLRPWKETGITRDMIERARKLAHFRVVIVDGKVYLEKMLPSFQSRDSFTWWGILQLLRWYPGRLPDLELLFNTDDQPVVSSKDFQGQHAGPPPLFKYCSDDQSLDIAFPDWSFWGWAEVNIKPWKRVVEEMKEGNKRTEWKDRIPYASWKGNPFVSPWRAELLKCNLTDNSDWNIRIFNQDWNKEFKEGFKNSNLADQCTYRYKIYIDGWGWSVSEKYIMACDSMTLYVKSKFYDFFIRGMLPLKHYWPINDTTKCPSLKFAVEWGNKHTGRAQGIGRAASSFIQENLKMENVYGYMYHLLNEYAKLLKFKPKIQDGAVEMCSETLACPSNGTWKEFMLDSLELSPSDSLPCTLPPPFDDLPQILKRRENVIRQVESLENEHWKDSSEKLS